MSTAIVNGGAIHGVLPVPFTVPYAVPHFSLEITISGLSYHLDAPLLSSPLVTDNQFETQFAVDKDVILIITLFGERIRPTNEFRASHYILNCKRTVPRARAELIRSTILAILGFSGKISLKIPDLGIDTSLLFDLPLREISHQLELRQIAYRLLVIEGATGKEFSLPETVSSQELDYLNRVYHLIIDRSVVGPIDPVEYSVPAVSEVLTWMESYDGTSRQILGPSPMNSKLFNQTVELGDGRIIVDDAYIVDGENVRRELSANDGHLVKVIISSTSGQAVYEAPLAPHLGNVNWDPTVNALISLEAKLDEALTERYHALAAGTLAGLSQEKKTEILTRPELDPEAFQFGE